MTIKPNSLPPLLMLTLWLSACATQKPVLQPIAIPQQKPVISPVLLKPARRQAMASLQTLLPESLPSAPKTPISSTP